MPSELEHAMESLITVFHRYASMEGNSNSLSRRELKDLMENELSGFLKLGSFMKPMYVVQFLELVDFDQWIPKLEIASDSVLTTSLILSHCRFLTLAQKDTVAVDRIMTDLDANGDGEVNFEEFVSLVVGLTVACEQYYQLHLKQQGKI
ncbi:hypothetical protein JZ751_000168 [Albula glossodonta]|uniref:Protein S100 n=1 Tax=Albula glossodonta TaxID=121402 RepID=A0A8T2PVD5_9TELE|nr:hypothetical protein JZ751_000168 [Albula glossodonta]